MPAETPLLAAIAFAGALIFGVTGFGSALVTIRENPKNAVRTEWRGSGP